MLVTVVILLNIFHKMPRLVNQRLEDMECDVDNKIFLLLSTTRAWLIEDFYLLHGIIFTIDIFHMKTESLISVL